jgi:ribosomal protein S6--L-glutamate ligase
MPATAVSEDPALVCEAVRRFGSAVLKPLYSTKARGMVVVEATDPLLASKVESFVLKNDGPAYGQQKLELGDRDLGVVFMGGQYVGTYARVRGAGAWNTTIHSGGRYEPHEPEREIIEIAERAQAIFDLEFTSVDVVETKRGPLVFEVSAFGGYRGLKEGLGIDPAARYADHILAKISGRSAA